MPQTVFRSGHANEWRSALFGREQEQDSLWNCVQTMLGDHGNLVFIGGEAGIGKTALVQTLAQRAQELGARSVASACYDLTVTPPYGPWLNIFKQLDAREELVRSTDSDTSSERHHATSQDAFFADAFASIAHAASKTPLVMVLEDLHWSDAASLEFLRYVARQIAELPVLIVVTYRDTEIDAGHPLYQLFPIIVRESHATRVHLRPLEDPAMRAFVRSHYDDGLSAVDEASIVNYLHERAEGNPLFIGEVLRTLEEHQYIVPVGNAWEITADLRLAPVPSLVRQVIEGRLLRLDGTARKLLSIASVIGQDIPVEVWQVVSDASDADLSAVISSATDLHLLEETVGPAPLRFTHALVREVLYFELNLPERRTLHRAVGIALVNRSWRDPDAIAYHYQAAADEEAPRWLMLAGERAQKLYAWRAAADRFESILPFIETDPKWSEARGWLAYRIGLLLIYADPERGISHLTVALEHATDIGDQHLAGYARADRGLLRCLTGDVRRGLDDMRSGVAALDDLPEIEETHAPAPENSWMSVDEIRRGALELIGTSPGINIRRGALIFWLAWTGRYHDTISIGEPYVANAPKHATEMPDSLGDALAGLGHAYAALGRPDESLEAFEQARETYRSIDHHFKVGNTAIYELSEVFLPFRADRVVGRQWLADQAEAG